MTDPSGATPRPLPASRTPDPAGESGRPGLASQERGGSSWPDPAAESLAHLLGGRRAAIDATLGPLAFGIGYLGTSSIGWGALAAVLVTAILGIWRLSKGDKPRAVLIGLFGVVLAALIALYTNRAEYFYLIRILGNVASLLAFVVSVAIRWPLLGVIVGGVLGQKSRWRHDPDLLRAYNRASLFWSLQYLIRAGVWIPFWLTANMPALVVTNLLLTWPLIAIALAGSWWIIQRTLPSGHPGLRHPVPAGDTVPVS